MAYIDRSRKFGSEREVRVIEGNVELAFLVEGVLEIDTCWLGSRGAFDGTLNNGYH